MRVKINTTKISQAEAKRFWGDQPLIPKRRVKLSKHTMARIQRSKIEGTTTSTRVKLEVPSIVTPKIRRSVGRPTLYDPKYAKIAAKAMSTGYTLSELADLFDTNTASIFNWSMRFPEFLSAIKLNKVAADDRVERTLYEKAVGWAYIDDDGVKRQSVPSDTAIVYWLGNRRRDTWKNVNRTEITGAVDGAPIKTINANMNAQEAADLYAMTLQGSYSPPLLGTTTVERESK